MKRELCVSNMLFELKSIYYYSRVCVNRVEFEVKSITDVVLVKEMLKYVVDVD